MNKKIFNSIKEEEMVKVANFLLSRIKPGDLIALSGELGTGKTTLSRIILKTLGHKGRVMSPSFIICCEYKLEIGIINHLDFYRMGSFDELIDLGIEEIIDESYLTIVEWSNMFEEELFEIATGGFKVILSDDKNSGRNIEIEEL